jgi:hypothetical protein
LPKGIYQSLQKIKPMKTLSSDISSLVGELGENASASTPTAAPVSDSLPERETAPAANDKICWIEVKHYPYQPDLQVELLHLQAEADALLLHLKTVQKRSRMAQN